jgi:hypothetical protein
MLDLVLCSFVIALTPTVLGLVWKLLRNQATPVSRHHRAAESWFHS